MVLMLLKKILICILLFLTHFSIYYSGWVKGHDNGFVHGVSAVYLEIIDVDKCMNAWTNGKHPKACDWEFRNIETDYFFKGDK